ncbi:hypothetical protein GMRT_14291 [Giardia muris]|uniref:Uncharacterized protein n=1 Tax=Giardia muris TaxID=5742 RepID=A0A4Z1T3D7_GIAMU|nr:hypothetical protein GMRT_14291 [Giardia muris]|eukprot:TNJ30168.1 hypothetical protein GMRT_14291 [Giardia muris]
MTLNITVEESKGGVVGLGVPIHVLAALEGFYPPADYDLVYAFYLCLPKSDEFRLIQSFSVDRRCTLCILVEGFAQLRCDVRVKPRRLTGVGMKVRCPTLVFGMENKDSFTPFNESLDRVLFTATVTLDTRRLGTQTPPCLVIPSNTISPIYVVPEHNIEPQALVRIVVETHEPPQAASAQYTEPRIFPSVRDFSAQGYYLDSKEKSKLFGKRPDDEDICNLRRGYVPPLKELVTTEWEPFPPGENSYIPLFGMVPGKQYEFRHQIMDEASNRQFELKSAIPFYAESVGMKSWLIPYQFIPIFTTDKHDRPFFVSVTGVPTFYENNNYVGDDRNADMFLRISSSGSSEAAIYSAYGQLMVYVHGSVQSGCKIIQCHRTTMLTISAGLCDWLHAGTAVLPEDGVEDLESTTISEDGSTKKKKKSERLIQKASRQTPKVMAELLYRTLNVSSGSDNTFFNQRVVTAILNGTPKYAYSIENVNLSLLRQAYATPDADYRPLVSITHVHVLEDDSLVIAGLAEMELTRERFPSILAKIDQSMEQIGANPKSYSGNDQKVYRRLQGVNSSLLTATILRISAQGDVSDLFYACDLFNDVMSTVQFVEVAWNSNEKGGLIPGFYTESKYALLHSYVSSLDCTQKDCLAVLPRQGGVVRLLYGAFSSFNSPSRMPLPNIAPQTQMLHVPVTIYPSVQPQISTPYAPYAGQSQSQPQLQLQAPQVVPTQQYANPYAQGPYPPATTPYQQPGPTYQTPYVASNPYLKGPTNTPPVSRPLDGGAPETLVGMDALKSAQDSVVLFCARPGFATLSDYMLHKLGFFQPLALSRMHDRLYAVGNTHTGLELIVMTLPYFVELGSKLDVQTEAPIARDEVEPVVIRRVVIQENRTAAVRLLVLQKEDYVVAWADSVSSGWRIAEVRGDALRFASRVLNIGDLALIDAF